MVPTQATLFPSKKEMLLIPDVWSSIEVKEWQEWSGEHKPQLCGIETRGNIKTETQKCNQPFSIDHYFLCNLEAGWYIGYPLKYNNMVILTLFAISNTYM